MAKSTLTVRKSSCCSGRTAGFIVALPLWALARLAQDEESGGAGGAARGGRGLGEGEVEMTDQKPWRLEDLAFESMGDDRREKATIDGVEIVREDGRYWIRTQDGPHYDNLAGDGVDAALNYLFGLSGHGRERRLATLLGDVPISPKLRPRELVGLVLRRDPGSLARST
jgi:hypothetical protein